MRANDFDIGCDDNDDIHFGHYSSVTDTSIAAKMTIGADGDERIASFAEVKIGGDTTSPKELKELLDDFDLEGGIGVEESFDLIISCIDQIYN